MKLCGLLFVIAACGGSPKGTARVVPEGSAGTEDVPKTECGMVARHVAEAVFTWAEPPPTKKDKVAFVISDRCEADKWSAEAKKCFGAITNEESAKPCVETLTKDQHDKVMNAMEATFDHKSHHHDDAKEGGTGARAPAIAPPPPPSKGGPAKGADPCEGGE